MTDQTEDLDLDGIIEDLNDYDTHKAAIYAINVLRQQIETLQANLHRAERALKRAGFTLNKGANEWKPPIGEPPAYIREAHDLSSMPGVAELGIVELPEVSDFNDIKGTGFYRASQGSNLPPMIMVLWGRDERSYRSIPYGVDLVKNMQSGQWYRREVDRKANKWGMWFALYPNPVVPSDESFIHSEDQ